MQVVAKSVSGWVDGVDTPQADGAYMHHLNFGMTIFNFHFLLLFLANLTSNWVIFDEKMERQA